MESDRPDAERKSLNGLPAPDLSVYHMQKNRILQRVVRLRHFNMSRPCGWTQFQVLVETERSLSVGSWKVFSMQRK